MILQCSDLERALRTPELMPDMRAHAETVRGVPRTTVPVVGDLAAGAGPASGVGEPVPVAADSSQPGGGACACTVAMADAGHWPPGVVVLAAAMLQPWRGAAPANRELLTEKALQEVQQAESAYARSIGKLSAVAAQDPQRSSSPVAAAYREKLTLLDSAIADAGHGGTEPLQHLFAHRTGVAVSARSKRPFRNGYGMRIGINLPFSVALCVCGAARRIQARFSEDRRPARRAQPARGAFARLGERAHPGEE